MDNLNLIESFAEFKEVKNIDRVTMMSILEEVILNMIAKKFGDSENFDVIINTEKGDMEIWRNREIVDDEWAEDSFDFDPNKHISLSDAKKIDEDFEIGEEVTDELKLMDFGRRSIQAMRQNLVSRITDMEKDSVYKKYTERVGEIISGEVYQVWRKELLVLDDEGNELILPKQEMIPTDFYKKGDTLRAVVLKVEMKNNSPLIILSRTSPVFLEKLFEQEVPEVFDGLITIKKIVRMPGERAKVAVESYDDRIDPVGACVGMKGSRIHGIVRELRNENIDVINYTNNQHLYVQRALSPAKITSIKLNDENHTAAVYLKPDQVSLAIGKGGLNIKLAGKLTGYEIDVYREDAPDTEDVALDEFRDEIEDWVIDELKSIGCDTAKNVLELSVGELIKRTDLEEETIKHVISILKSEFED
ncbi:MAG: transcription termination/antitermination protein NusA [Flavobacteriales bacterium]|nr:transcription termination/antitermination protein NusA [Flavobacteriales bacterium]